MVGVASGSGQSRQRLESGISDVQRQYLDQVLSSIFGYTQGEKPFQGNVPGLSDATKTSLAALEQRAMNLFGGQDGGRQAAADSIFANAGGVGADFNEFYTKNVQDPLLRSFNEGQVGRDLAAAGTGSARTSDASNQTRLAGRDLLESLSGARSSLAYQERNAGLDRALALLGIDPGIISGTNELASIAGVGELGRQPGKEQLAFDAEQQNLSANRLLAALSLLAQTGTTQTNIGLTNSQQRNSDVGVLWG